MVGLSDYIGPASETYAGFAWEYLRRNQEYCETYRHVSSANSVLSQPNTLRIRREHANDKLAHQWGLECFEDPLSSSLDASVFWRQDAFPGALSVQYQDVDSKNVNQDTFNLSNFDCQKQHYLRSDGTRISVIKTENLWLQLSGKTDDATDEEQPFSVLINGEKGARRRIDALRQLTSLSRDGSADFKLLGRQKAFMRLRNALKAYDIRAAGGSYKDIATALFGAERIANEWDHNGGYLKARASRSFKFAERMVAQDYQSLLPKKAI